MAKEYIEREATVMKIREWFWSAPGVHPKLDRDTAEDILFAIPAADVRPVVHAEWICIGRNLDGTSDFECSACLGILMDVPDDDEHDLCTFCPACGAKMDGGQDDA